MNVHRQGPLGAAESAATRDKRQGICWVEQNLYPELSEGIRKSRLFIDRTQNSPEVNELPLCCARYSKPYICACSLQKVGSFTVSPRLQRHFAVLACNMPDVLSLGRIVQSLLQAHFQASVPQQLMEGLVQGLIAAYTQVPRPLCRPTHASASAQREGVIPALQGGKSFCLNSFICPKGAPPVL